MNAQQSSTPALLPNGAGAAALLAAGIGSFLLGVFAILGDRSAFFKNFFTFSRPTGPLSGVTTSAIAVWLVCWTILHARWRNRTVALTRIGVAALVLLGLGLLLTFPPLANLF